MKSFFYHTFSSQQFSGSASRGRGSGASNIVSLEAVTKSYSEKTPLNAVHVGIDSTDKVGVIGVNGSGKSTLLKLVAGIITPDSGHVVHTKGLTVEYLDQNPTFTPTHTVLQAAGGTRQAEAYLDRFGLAPFFTQPVSVLSGGQRRRVGLARVLSADPDLLILDEPTNHLDPDIIEWLEGMLRSRHGALLFVTHDRYVLGEVANRIFEVVDGHIYTNHGSYEDYLETRALRIEQSQTEQRKRANLARRELEWLRRGPKARTSKAKYRVDAAHKLIAQTQQVVDESVLEIDLPSRRLGSTVVNAHNAGMVFPVESAALAHDGGDGGRVDDGRDRGLADGRDRGLGDGEFDRGLADDVDESVVDRGLADGDKQDSRSNETRVVLREVFMNVPPKARWGIIGPNGSGKSTLLSLITGRLMPTTGSVRIGETVHIGWYGQEPRAIPPQTRVLEAVREVAEETSLIDELTVSASQLLERFLFPKAVQRAYVEELSGGERRRLELLLVLAEAPNVLVLDEPTNDLDLDTLEVLVEYLEHWPGTMLVASHDRWFLDRVCTDLYAINSTGHVVHQPGGWTAWRERQKEEARKQARKDVPEQDDQPEQSVGRAQQKKKRLTYKEQQEFDGLPERIEELTQRAQILETKLAAGDDDFEKLTALTTELAEVTEQIENAELRWLELGEIIE